MTIVAGTIATSTTRAVVSRSPSRRARSTMKAARATASSTLPSSDAWISKNGVWIARREPRVVPPKAATASNPTSSSP